MSLQHLNQIVLNSYFFEGVKTSHSASFVTFSYFPSFKGFCLSKPALFLGCCFFCSHPPLTVLLPSSPSISPQWWDGHLPPYLHTAALVHYGSRGNWLGTDLVNSIETFHRNEKCMLTPNETSECENMRIYSKMDRFAISLYNTIRGLNHGCVTYFSRTSPRE